MGLGQEQRSTGKGKKRRRNQIVVNDLAVLDQGLEVVEASVTPWGQSRGS